MIVQAPKWRDNATVWQLEPEPDDEPPPYEELWVNWLLRPQGTAVEALWLALAMGRYAHSRIVLPAPAPQRLRAGLEAVLGVAIVTAPAELSVTPGEFNATLIRDPLDAMLSLLAHTETEFDISSGVDPHTPGIPGTGIGVVSNAGPLRRYHCPLDRIGELATVLLLAPALSLAQVRAFLFCDELGDLGSAALSELAGAAGIQLSLPIDRIRACEFGHVAKELEIPASIVFRAAWKRYWMAPAVIGAIYHELQHDLTAYGDDPVLRMCRHMAQTAPRIERRFDKSQLSWAIPNRYNADENAS